MLPKIAKLASEAGFDVSPGGRWGNYSEMHKLDRFARLLLSEVTAETSAPGAGGPAQPSVFDIFEPSGPVKTADGEIENFTVKVAGKPFRCKCSCNVFHKPYSDTTTVYQCNACQEQFEAE